VCRAWLLSWFVSGLEAYELAGMERMDVLGILVLRIRAFGCQGWKMEV